MEFVPTICGDDIIHIPQEGCSDCERLEARVDEVEAKNEEQDERLDTLETCCEDVQETISNHETRITQSELDIKVVENEFGNYYKKTETYTQAQVDTLISQIEVGGYEEVATLPTVGDPNVIYLVPKQGGGYERWIYSNGQWKDLGSADVDLTDYVKVDDVIDMIHPVGDTVIRLDSTDPSTLYTGTSWQLVSQGRMIIGASTDYPLGTYGGEATHTLTVNEMPSHTHIQDSHSHYRMRNGREFVSTPVSASITRHTTASGSGAPNMLRSTQAFYSDQYVGDTIATNQYTGGSSAHNNMPPYLAVNIWLRTA